MTRYFFDVVTAARSERDALGTSLSSHQEALTWAQLLALALASGEQELAGGRIGVRGSDGCELFSVPIRRHERPHATRAGATAVRLINAACPAGLWTAVRGRWLGVKTPQLAGENDGRGGSV